ncbi:hypothetical protein BD289DRAFT_361295 [Coniella lustricola]|uniref:Uncharacterized protein n=1 Tax=Coniella lustricola TaxID=2025994 RepID=A0A2T3AIK8_9PEZI|nr:hypothetical protein BD289DRAFT_361295 [Coniella lustricola]
MTNTFTNLNAQLITELLQTRHCQPGSVLLVEDIESQIPISDRSRTVRLLLGDGELCIQALLWPELHRLVDDGKEQQELDVGCYVRLNKFELRSIPVSNNFGGEVVEKGDGGGRPQRNDEMVFLVVRDLRVVGYNAAYVQMIQQTSHADLGGNARQMSDRVSPSPAPRFVQKATTNGLGKDNVDIASVALPPKHLQQAANTNHPPPREPPAPRPAAESSIPNQTASHSHSLSHHTFSQNSQTPKLTPLKSIPNLPYKQNWILNVLAIVVSLSDVELAILPPNKQPFKQRTARLADPSTDKHVLLTVFLDPHEFAPAVGSVVLLLTVKNHRFDGGSLKKYANERPREGARWWFENPRDLEWCDVDGLQNWWAEKRAE